MKGFYWYQVALANPTGTQVRYWLKKIVLGFYGHSIHIEVTHNAFVQWVPQKYRLVRRRIIARVLHFVRRSSSHQINILSFGHWASMQKMELSSNFTPYSIYNNMQCEYP